MEHHPRGPSSLDRLSKCPGSDKLCQGLPEIEGEYAVEGTRLHELVIPGNSLDELDTEPRQAVERCRERLASYTGGAREDNIFYEHRLELEDMFGIVVSFGTADLVVLYPDQNTATIVDWKFGYNDVPPPEANVQIQAYAVMASQKFGLSSVTCIVFCPRQYQEKRFEFEKHDLEQAESNVRYVLELPDRDDSLHLNSHCQYCNARLECPERIKETQRMVLYQSMDAMATDTLSDRVIKWKIITKIAKDEEDELRKRLAAGIESPTWELKEKQGNRTITDINKAHELSLEFYDSATFLGFCNVPLGKFKDDWIKKHVQMHGGTLKSATERFFEIMPIGRGDSKVEMVRKKD